jgi:exonuclease III
MASSNILVWNTHGLNDRARSDSVRLVIDTCRPSIVCIQETKLAKISSRDVLTLLGSDYSSFTYLAAQGTRGGILVAWRDGGFQSTHYRIHRHSVSVHFSVEGESAWWFTGVYGPHIDAKKPAFLEELREVRGLCPGPWLVAGDFNMIYCSEDKNNENVNMALMGHFHRFINKLELKTFAESSIHMVQ